MTKILRDTDNRNYLRTLTDSPADELDDLIDEFPQIAREIPLHHLAAYVGCSADAIDLAERRHYGYHDDRDGFPVLTARSDVPDESGALIQWLKELRAGVRKLTDMDVLHRAACHEAAAREDLRAGLWAAAKYSRTKAIETILDAARRPERKHAA